MCNAVKRQTPKNRRLPDQVEFTVSYKARDMVCRLMVYLFDQKRYSANN